MSAIQITPSGIGQTMMIGAVIAGGILIGDAFFFMADKPSLLGYFNIAVHLDERIRGVAEIFTGLLLGMFGLGVWTVQVGGLAIISVLFLTLGNYWQVSNNKGTANQRTATVSTPSVQQASVKNKRYTCRMTPSEKAWCQEDHDKDGVINMYDQDHNERGQGIQNCTTGQYITDSKKHNNCTAIK